MLFCLISHAATTDQLELLVVELYKAISKPIKNEKSIGRIVNNPDAKAIRRVKSSNKDAPSFCLFQI